MLNIIRFIKNKKKYKNLDESFKTIGITVSGFEYLKPSVWQDIYDILTNLFKQYFFIPIGYLKEIRVYSKKEYFNLTFPKDLLKPKQNNTILETSLLPVDSDNLKYYVNYSIIIINANYIRNLKKYLKAIVKPKNRVKYVIIHEFGHIIDFYFSITSKFKCDQINYMTYNAALCNLKLSKQIVDPILIKYNYNYDETALKMGNKDLNTSSEILAETIALNNEGFKMDLSDQIYISFLNQIKG